MSKRQFVPICARLVLTSTQREFREIGQTWTDQRQRQGKEGEQKAFFLSCVNVLILIGV